MSDELTDLADPIRTRPIAVEVDGIERGLVSGGVGAHGTFLHF